MKPFYCEKNKTLTQPSHTLCRFEKELEVSIFKRTTNGIEALGAKLLEPSVQRINTSHAIVRGLGHSSSRKQTVVLCRFTL